MKVWACEEYFNEDLLEVILFSTEQAANQRKAKMEKEAEDYADGERYEYEVEEYPVNG